VEQPQPDHVVRFEKPRSAWDRVGSAAVVAGRNLLVVGCESLLSSPSGRYPFIPPLVRPPTTRSWKMAISTQIGTIATISAAEMIGQGNENSPW
jgi:hypothetical protein